MAQEVRNDPILEGVPRIQGYALLDPCLIYGLIGQGGMGSVYVARHLRLNIDCAVKCMRPDGAARPDSWVLRFQREATLAASISHQNLVRAYDIRQYRDLHYIVMEYVRGENARQHRRRRGELSIDEAVAVVDRASAGLAAAHQAGVVHRDIKPDNILISTDGVVKVADLGLAKALELVSGGAQATLHTAAIGTPQYMAPEQWEDSRTVGPAADTYSLGATLYFLLTGTDAHAGGTLREVMRRTLTGPFPDVRALRADVTAELAAFVAKATAVEAAQRFPDAGAFHEALQRFAKPRSLAGLRESIVASWLPPNDPPATSVLEEAKGAISTTGLEDFPLELVTPPETLPFDCPGCGARLQMPTTAAGRTGRCPHCQSALTVPLSAPRLKARASSPGTARPAAAEAGLSAPGRPAGRPGTGRAANAPAETLPDPRPRQRPDTQAPAGARRRPLLVAGGLLLLAAGGVLLIQSLGHKAAAFDAAAFESALATCDLDAARRILAQAETPPEIRSVREQQVQEHERIGGRLAELQQLIAAARDEKALIGLAASGRAELADSPPCVREKLESALGAADESMKGRQKQKSIDTSRAALRQALAECDPARAKDSLATLTASGAASPADSKALEALSDSLAALEKRENELLVLRNQDALVAAATRLELELPNTMPCLKERAGRALEQARARLVVAANFQKRQSEVETRVKANTSARDALGLLAEVEKLGALLPDDVAVEDRRAELRQRALQTVKARLDVIAQHAPDLDLPEIIELLTALDVAAADTPSSQAELEKDVVRLLEHLTKEMTAGSPPESAGPALKAIAAVMNARGSPSFAARFGDTRGECRKHLETHVDAVSDMAWACSLAQRLEDLRDDLEPHHATQILDTVRDELVARAMHLTLEPQPTFMEFANWRRHLGRETPKPEGASETAACSRLKNELFDRSAADFYASGLAEIQRNKRLIEVTAQRDEDFLSAADALQSVVRWSDRDSELQLRAQVALGDAYWHWAFNHNTKGAQQRWADSACEAYERVGQMKPDMGDKEIGTSLKAHSLCQHIRMLLQLAEGSAAMIKQQASRLKDMNAYMNSARSEFRQLQDLYPQERDAQGVSFVDVVLKFQQGLDHVGRLSL